MDKTNKTAIIILNYNSWKETIEEAKICRDFLDVSKEDIIVVDNCSTNNSAVELNKYSDTLFRLLISERNGGYAAGNNIGLRYAFNLGYDYAWILNNDILISDKDIISKLLCVFEKDDNIAVVNPDIYSSDGHLYNRDSKRPSFFDYTIGAYSYKRKGRDIKDLGGYGIVYRPQGCCMMVDLVKLNEVGFLDENTFLYFEENILAEKLQYRNYACACCLSAGIVHNHSKTVKSNLDKKKIRKINNNSFVYYLKNYRSFNYLQIFICKLFNTVKLILLD